MESVLKKILKRNASLLRAARSMLTFLVFFIPSTYKYYEAIVEGCYSISQIILFYQNNYSNTSSCGRDSLSQQSTTVANLTVSFVQELSILTSLLELFLEKLVVAMSFDLCYQSQLIFVIELIKTLSRFVFIIQSKCCTVAINWTHEFDSQGNVLDIYNYARHYQRISYRYLNQQLLISQTAKDLLPPESSSSSSAAVGLLHEKQQTYIGRRSGLILNASGIRSHQQSSSSNALEGDNVDSELNANTVDKGNKDVKVDISALDSDSGNEGASDEHESGYTSSSSFNADEGSTGPSFQNSINNNSENEAKTLEDSAAVAGGVSATCDRINTATTLQWSDKVLEVISNQYSELQVKMSRYAATSLANDSCEKVAVNVKLIAQHAENQSRRLYQSVVNYKFPLSAGQCLQFGEVLYVLRPLIYAWMKHSMTTSAKSKKYTSGEIDSSLNDMYDGADGKYCRYVEAVALAASLVIELLSIQLTSLGLELIRNEVYKASINAFSKQCATGLDRSMLQPVMSVPSNANSWHKFDEELRRRKFALSYYLIRSPLFDKATLPFMKILSKSLKYIPIINTLPESLLGAFSYINKSHFRSSASSPNF